MFFQPLMFSGLLPFTESINIISVMSKVAPFSIGPVTSRCLPFRTVKGMGRHQLNPFQNAELVAWAVSQNLAETTSFYDDDVALAWTPQAADFYKDPKSQFWKHLADVKAKLDAAQDCDLVFSEITHYPLEKAILTLEKLRCGKLKFYHIHNPWQTQEGRQKALDMTAHLPYPVEFTYDGCVTIL